MSLPVEVLIQALGALDSACTENLQNSHARLQSEARLSAWRAQLGLGSEAIQICIYCLEHSQNLRAKFFACKVLQDAFPTCVADGLLPIQQIWDLRTQLLQYAISMQASRPTRFLCSALLPVISCTDIAGFAVAEPHETVPPRGYGEAMEAKLHEQLQQVLRRPENEEQMWACKTALLLADELINRFDDRNILGAVKTRAADRVRNLSWSQLSHAKVRFRRRLLVQITEMLLNLLESLLGDVVTFTEILEHLFTVLVAALDFHHDDHDQFAAKFPSLSMPGVYDPGYVVADGSELTSWRPIHLRRHVDPAMEALVVRPQTLPLLKRALNVLTEALDPGGPMAKRDDEELDDDIPLFGCRATFEIAASYIVRSSSDPKAAGDWPIEFFETLSELIAGRKGAHRNAEECLFHARTLRVFLLASGAHADIYGNALMLLTTIGVRAARFASLEASADRDLEAREEAEKVGMEALTEICLALYIVASAVTEPTLRDLVEHVAAKIFDAFVEAKMDGAALRSAWNASYSEIDEEVAAGFKDKDMSYGLLQSVATIGRLCPRASLSKMNNLCNQLVARMLNIVHRDVHPSDSVESRSARDQDLATAHEQTHWAILISGFLLADDGRGEVSSVPRSFLTLSRGQVCQIHSKISTCSSAAFQPAEQDLLLQIIRILFHLVRSLAVQPGSEAATRCSPQVAEDLHWFIGRISLTYILTDAAYTGPLSPNLNAAFGGDAGLEVLHHLFACMALSVKQYSAEEDALIEIGHALRKMSHSRLLCVGMTRLRSFAEFVESVLVTSAVLSVKATTTLWTGIIECVASCLHVSEGRILFDEVIRVTENRMQQVMEDLAYQTHRTVPSIKVQVNSVLDMYAALLTACHPAAIAVLTPVLSKFCPAALGWLETYKDTDEVFCNVLDFFCKLASHLQQGFDDATETELAWMFPNIYKAIQDGSTIIKQSQMEGDQQRESLGKLVLTIEHLLRLCADVEGASRAQLLWFLPSALAAICPLVKTDDMLIPSFLTPWARLSQCALRIAPEEVETAACDSEGPGVLRTLRDVLVGAFSSLNDEDKYIALEATESLATHMLRCDRPLVQLTSLLENLVPTCLTTLCFEECSATNVPSYLYTLQISLLAISRTNADRLGVCLSEFAAQHSGRVSNLGLAIERLIGILTHRDAFVTDGVRGGRGRMAATAKDQAYEVLRSLRVEVRL